VSEDCFIDALGTTWRKAQNNIYFEIHEHPLRNATIDALETYQWPDFSHPSRFKNLRAEAKALHDDGQAVLLFTGAGIFSPAYEMRSVEQLLFDLAANPDFVTVLMTKLEKLTIDCMSARCGNAASMSILW